MQDHSRSYHIRKPLVLDVSISVLNVKPSYHSITGGVKRVMFNLGRCSHLADGNAIIKRSSFTVE